MCRYHTQPYKTHWVCFDCRRVVKERPHDPRRCLCGEAMIDFGRDFHAPRKTQANQWAKLKLLAQKHELFHSCGCQGPGYRPKTYSEAKHSE